MMQMLLDTELKQVSMGAIQQFNLDVIQCEREYRDTVTIAAHHTESTWAYETVQQRPDWSKVQV